MAVGKKFGGSLKLKRGVVADEEMNIRFVRYARALGRKQFVISNDKEESRMVDFSSRTPSKRQCGDKMAKESVKFPLEDLPPDVLIRVICGVDHDDLKKLIMVSKFIKDATLNAKRLHFAYSTPKKFKAFRTKIQFEEPNELDEIEAPDAPKRKFKTRSFRKELTSISVDLFPSLDEECLSRKPLFMEEEQ